MLYIWFDKYLPFPLFLQAADQLLKFMTDPK